jgi:hypothetical protein
VSGHCATDDHAHCPDSIDDTCSCSCPCHLSGGGAVAVKLAAAMLTVKAEQVTWAQFEHRVMEIARACEKSGRDFEWGALDGTTLWTIRVGRVSHVVHVTDDAPLLRVTPTERTAP